MRKNQPTNKQTKDEIQSIYSPTESFFPKARIEGIWGSSEWTNNFYLVYGTRQILKKKHFLLRYWLRWHVYTDVLFGWLLQENVHRRADTKDCSDRRSGYFNYFNNRFSCICYRCKF